MFFWILWCIDAITSLVVIYFFMIGLADSSISAQNMVLWMILLAAVGSFTGVSYWLHTHQHPAAAKWVAALLALPAAIYILFVLFILVAKPRWN